MRLVRAFYPICGILILQGIPRTLLAEAAATGSDAKLEELVPPSVELCDAAEWPIGQEPRPGQSVLFELTIDVEGHVENPVIVQSAGPTFDVIASQVIARCKFKPARKGSVPIPVRIRYRLEFQPPERKTPVPEPEHASPFSGPKSDKSAAPDVDWSRLSPPQSEQSPDVTSSVSDVDNAAYGAVAQIAAPPREVTRHSVEQQDLTKIPGTSGDALRAIEVLPGVARTSISSGDPILRGAAWNESRSFIEGTTVPLLYHFGGVKSAFNSRLLSRVDLYPGNYGTSFGRAVGGVIAAKVRDPERDRLHAVAEASVIDSMAMLETPVGKNAAIAVAGRRSNIDLFYDALAPKSSFSVVAAPVYYDYQGIGWFKLGARHQLRVLSYGSRDTLKLIFANPSDFDPALRDRVDVAIEYHRLQASLESKLSSRFTQRIQFTYGYTTMRQMVGNVRAELNENDLMSRGEWNYRSSDSLRINVGYDAEAINMRGYYIGPRPPQAEGEVMNGGMSTESAVDLSDLAAIRAIRPAIYSELEWRPLRQFLVVPGIRVDYYSDQGAATLNPRLSNRYDVHERLSIKWGIGTYSQNPQYYEMIRNFGNPRLRPYHALHYSAGFEHRPSEALSWGIEGFYKWLTGRVVSTPGGVPPSFVNDGIGRIYGAELFARYTTARLRSWLAYTISRSERRDRNDPWRLFEKDQTHVLAVTANYQLGRGWELGGRFRLTSGNPYTPVNAAVYDANQGVYRPIDARPFSDRNPVFHQLDLRIEKTVQFSVLKFSAYLDVQNVYNAKNYEGFDYSYDYAKRQRVAGLPLLPNLGLRGEL